MSKGEDVVVISLLRDWLPEDFRELRELKIEVPLESWNRLLKHVRTDRKLLGGIMLDFTKQKEQLPVAVGSDRLFSELQCMVIDATASLVESTILTLTVVDVGTD
ncbi:MAG: hypothetical protein JRG89_15505 [Deltaproteobacteria bacterium]|nr:hypothetical protein [Deltaproteobacteria bacterium]MBW2723580.1 hypothetical protein [Deltaproteobacteria bacterium]